MRDVTTRRKLLLGAAAGVAVAATAGAVRLAYPKGAGLPAVGQVIPVARRPEAPDIAGTSLTGGHLDTRNWRGHVTVVNFWGSWCVPCREEAAVLARVARDTATLGVRFLGIDIREDPFAGLGFEQDFHIPYPSISDPDNLIAALFGADAPAATPSTYVIDARGRIAWAWFGSTTYSQLDLAVTEVSGL
jgi:thiol-disulfide isomerase/thioredoxin